ncbi:hypothetical protein ABZ820_32425 [Streptomyces diacarni]|uniref:hypothetical protein n=1 Tax=Streptomyces diacarni TaxID=2800381 RepID=UPI0033E8EE6B
MDLLAKILATQRAICLSGICGLNNFMPLTVKASVTWAEARMDARRACPSADEEAGPREEVALALFDQTADDFGSPPSAARVLSLAEQRESPATEAVQEAEAGDDDADGSEELEEEQRHFSVTSLKAAGNDEFTDRAQAEEADTRSREDHPAPSRKESRGAIRQMPGALQRFLAQRHDRAGRVLPLPCAPYAPVAAEWGGVTPSAWWPRGHVRFRCLGLETTVSSGR